MSIANPKVKTSPSRLGYLDWLRGLAAVVMLQGHVFHSFTGKELREGSVYTLSQFVGGMPPAVFLFLTGVTLAFLMNSSERKGLPTGERILVALRRAGFLFGLAYMFRFQLWLFGWPGSPWTDLLKVDILNCMGLGLAIMSLMAAFTTVDRVRLCAALGVAIAAVSPLVSQLDWNGVPTWIRAYLVPDYNYFSLFPWAAFLAFGVSAGSLLRLLRPDSLERTFQWGAIFGFALILAARYAADIPYSIYAKSDFWLDSPAQIFVKLGVILVLLAVAYVWDSYVINEKWNWLQQLGTTSLLVYWVHIELVYGRWFWAWKENLSLAQTFAMAVFVIGLMLLLSVVRTRGPQIRAWLTGPEPGVSPEAD